MTVAVVRGQQAIVARSGARVVRSALFEHFFFASPFCSSIRKPYLYARFGQRDFLRQTLARINVRIVSAFELSFERVDLLLRKRGSIALQLSL